MRHAHLILLLLTLAVAGCASALPEVTPVFWSDLNKVQANIAAVDEKIEDAFAEQSGAYETAIRLGASNEVAVAEAFRAGVSAATVEVVQPVDVSTIETLMYLLLSYFGLTGAAKGGSKIAGLLARIGARGTPESPSPEPKAPVA